MAGFTSRQLLNALGALAAALAAQAAAAAISIDLVSDPGDAIGNGSRAHFATDTGSITVQQRGSDGKAGLSILYTDASSRWNLDFNPARGKPLLAGNYEQAHKASLASPIRPGLDVNGQGRTCTLLTGRFTVREVQYLAGGEIARLALDFEQHCESAAPALRGYVRIDSTFPAFAPQPVAVAGAAFGTDPGLLTTLDGSNSYDVDGRIVSYSWRQVAGPAVSLTSTITARTQFVAPAVPPGGASVEFELTVTDDSALTGTDRIAVLVHHPLDARTRLYVNSQPAEIVFGGGEKLYTENDGFYTAGPINGLATDEVAVRFQGDDFNWLAWFGAPRPAVLAPGLYADAQRTAFRDPGRPGVDVSTATGCNFVTGRFRILELVYGANGSVDRFAADFVQRCENAAGPLFGSVRFNSAAAIRSLDIDADGIPDALEEALGRDPVTADNDVYGSSRLFVMQQYRDYFGREAEAPGVAYWMGQIDSGALTREQVLRAFLESAEFGGRIAPIARLYFAALLRAPDNEGLFYWVQVLASGQLLSSIAHAFSQSPEFIGRFGALDNRAFMTLLYQSVLGRNPDAPGLDYWAGQLDAFALSRGQVLEAFSQSPEYIQAIGNEVFTAMLYAGALRRTADANGFAFWVGRLDAGVAREAAAASFIYSPEYRARFLRP